MNQVILYNLKLVSFSCKTDNPCLNGGSCNETDKGLKCICTNGFVGMKCELTMKELDGIVANSVSLLETKPGENFAFNENSKQALDSIAYAAKQKPDILDSKMQKLIVGISDSIATSLSSGNLKPDKAIFGIFELGMSATM